MTLKLRIFLAIFLKFLLVFLVVNVIGTKFYKIEWCKSTRFLHFFPYKSREKKIVKAQNKNICSAILNKNLIGCEIGAMYLISKKN